MNNGYLYIFFWFPFSLFLKGMWRLLSFCQIKKIFDNKFWSAGCRFAKFNSGEDKIKDYTNWNLVQTWKQKKYQIWSFALPNNKTLNFQKLTIFWQSYFRALVEIILKIHHNHDQETMYMTTTSFWAFIPLILTPRCLSVLILYNRYWHDYARINFLYLTGFTCIPYNWNTMKTTIV